MGKKYQEIECIDAANLTEQNIGEKLPRGQENLDKIRSAVEEILHSIHTRGDSAIKEFTEKFDKINYNTLPLEVGPEEFDEAFKVSSPQLIDALTRAKKNIETFHKAQYRPDWFIETQSGVNTGQVMRPLERVGLYIPGGKAVYPSTVLMTAVPAKVAGVSQVILCSPPQADGKVASAILVAAKLCGVNKVFRCGGAQAVAGMAYGTNSIPAVQKIVGPGNKWVAAAKQLVSSQCAIDNPAGPSEVLVVIDNTTKSEWAAYDLLAQIEHGPDNIAVLLSEDSKKTEEIISELWSLVNKSPRKSILEANLKEKALIIESYDTSLEIRKKERIRLINLVAAEHLHIECQDARSLLPLIQNSGAVFLGPYSPVPLGDYCAGTNHVLPTSGYSRFYSGLSLFDFVKIMDVLDCKPSGLIALEKILAPIAEFEGLPGHYETVRVRAEYLASHPDEIPKGNPLNDNMTFPSEVKKLCRKAFEQLSAYTPGEQPQDMDLWVKLNTNENPSEPPEAVIKALEDAILHRMRMYPDPLSKKLREAIAKNYLSRYNTLNSPDNIVVANGSDEVLDILFKTFVDPGDRVIYFKPSYGMYPTLAETYEGIPVEITLTPDFQIPESIYEEQGKLMILCSPNNPTGNTVSNETIKKICRSFNGIVFVDEAYSDFADSTVLDILKECPNLVVGRTFSKSFSLASIRLGFAIANTTIINLFNTIRLPYNVSYLTQVAGIAAMENWKTVLSRVDLIKKERDRVIQRFNDAGFEIFPTQSNFYLMKFPSVEFAAKINSGLKDRKILARYWSKPELARFLRVTVGTKEQNDKFIAAVIDISKTIK